MDKKSRHSFSELKVGLFVIITASILGLAIFTIGTQVGLLEETFAAKSYLNNISGLKPGDIVLIAGVEAGNVSLLRISEPGEIPPTESNKQNLELIDQLSRRSEDLSRNLSANREKLVGLESEYEKLVAQRGPESPRTRPQRREFNNLRRLVESQEDGLKDVADDIREARRRLQNIEVFMDIKVEYREWIRRDSNISLGSVGLLGDKYVEVSLGRTEALPLVDQEVFDAWFGAETTREVVVITGSSEPGFQELITGANDVLANLEVLSKKLQGIMEDLGEGEGSVGKFITDPSFFENLNQTMVGAQLTVDRAANLVKQLSEGEGTLPSLIREQDVYENIKQATANLQVIMEKINQADGTLGKLIQDPGVYQKLDQLMANLESVTSRMDSGEGTLGKLSTDEKLYQDLTQALEQMTSLMRGVEEGKGTLGRLVQDEQLYQSLNRVSSEIVKLIYDFRQDPKKFLTIKFELF